jgi:hypothetical protein
MSGKPTWLVMGNSDFVYLLKEVKPLGEYSNPESFMKERGFEDMLEHNCC